MSHSTGIGLFVNEFGHCITQRFGYKMPIMKIVADNRRARFDYEIQETLEAGLVLTGQEVKSCRLGHANLAGAYVSFRGQTPVLRQATISKYPFASGVEDEPTRDRPLLLKKAEAERIRSAIAEKGITVIPLQIRAGKYIKVVLAVGRGRKKLDKRRVIREREVKRGLREGRDM